MLKPGDRAPDAVFVLADGTHVNVAALGGRPAVIYFYPKDDTPGCTTEAKDFSALAADFAALGARVIGVSKDSPQSHVKFAKKHDLSVELISDVDGVLCEAFGVWIEKSMYGRTYMGIERATFLIDADGQVASVWGKVKVKGHAESVLATLRAAVTS